jgi:hypothetical protein
MMFLLLMLPGISLTGIVLVGIANSDPTKPLPEWLINCSVLALPMVGSLTIGFMLLLLHRRDNRPVK